MKNNAAPLTDLLLTMDDVYAFMRKDAKHYAAPEDGTNRQKADAYERQVILLETAFNGKKRMTLADTENKKWSPFYSRIKDKKAPAGFRLAFYVSFFVNDCDDLGVRPRLWDKSHSDRIGITFLSVLEKWVQYKELAERDEA